MVRKEFYMKMKKPIYIRDGQRFKRVEDHVGDFWTKEGLWQKERDKNCVGQCVKQDAEKYTIVMFKLVKASWYEADKIVKKRVHRDARVPSIGELMELLPKLNEIFGGWETLWSSTEYDDKFAWCLCYYIRCDYSYKYFIYHVLSFVDIYYK